MKATKPTAPPSTRGARPTTPPAEAPGKAPSRIGPTRSLRELLESLSLAAQFRLVVVVSVIVTLVLLHATMALVEVWSARHAAIDSVRQSAGAGAELIDVLGKRFDVLSVSIMLPSGEILGQYVRTAAPTHEAAGASVANVSSAQSSRGWLRRVGEALALQPTVLSLPVQMGSDLAATAHVALDQTAFWNSAAEELGEIPLTLAIGLLIALLAANSLQRQVVEPLIQLASSTRVGNWATGAPAAARPLRRNELTELASNFDTLADRLAEYERDLRNLRLTSARKIIEQTREMEQRLRAAEALTRAKDDFLANMSHEIRTPMNGVLGMTELLANTNLDKRQQRFVDAMRTAAQTMMQIINDILDDSKIEAGKMDLVCEPFEVRRLMEDIGQLYAGAAESKKLELICRIEPGVPKVVVGDVLRLRQILGNLVSNAIKYTESGEVQIRAAPDELKDGRCHLHFSVADTGPGIPESQHAMVFQAFTQLENATRVGGTGLGLSIASRLVRLMGGGSIDLRSEPGHGSTFSFLLPFEVGEESDSKGTDDGFPGLRVLVVDDNSSSYMQLEETLNEWSVDVTVVNRGRVMLDRLRSAAQRGPRFDVVLIDHSLPDMTPAEMLRAIRVDPVTSSTYAVLMTALAFEADDDGNRSIEPDECIPKPVPLDLLKRCLQTARLPRTAGATPARAGNGNRRVGTLLLGLDVLVVDDNPVNREVAVAMLEDRRCQVAVAGDGRAAVTRALAQRFDVILMDCQMPIMDGYAATTAIRQEESRRGTASTPIVALTANVMARDRDRCMAAGMTSFLAKPFTPTQLEDALRPIAEARGSLRVPEAVDSTLTCHSADAHDTALPARPPEDGPLEELAVIDMLEGPLFAPADESAVATTQPGVLDLEQVEAIRSLGKSMVFEKLCALLFASAPATLQSIGQALAAGDLGAVADAAHSLKSSCANLGGRQLAAQLDRCEMAARDARDIEQARAAAVGLEQSYAALAAALVRESERPTGTS